MELLAVTTVVAVLAAVLYPVFRRVEDASRATVCAANFHQVGLASLMYSSDYDDKFMPIGDLPDRVRDLDAAHSWVQILLPYSSKSFSIFHCPADQTGPIDLSTFDQDLVPGDSDAEFYLASLHVNTGFNYQYLSPLLFLDGQWQADPRSDADVRDPSRAILFVDSKWSLKQSDTTDGGSWLVVPPCRYEESSSGAKIDTFLAGTGAQRAFVLDAPWFGNDHFGAAWPWHMGRMTVAHVDGSVVSLSPAELRTGCGSDGRYSNQIADSKLYSWSGF